MINAVDARIMLAAPDLLAVARMAEAVAAMELGEGLAPDFGPRELLDAARAAIAKAEGKPAIVHPPDAQVEW